MRGDNVNRGGVKRRLTRYSLVAREWHCFFAGKLFGRLTVTQGPDFDQLGTVGNLQCALIKHLWLRIAMAPYDCDQCSVPESHRAHEANVDTTRRAVQDLLRVISSWDPLRNGYPVGMTLEISMLSPSDRCHGFAAYDFDALPAGLEGAIPSSCPGIKEAVADHAFRL